MMWKRLMKTLVFWVLVVSVLPFIASSAWADTWALPETQVYRSPNGVFRLTVNPRALASQVEYFADRVGGRKPAAQRPGGRVECRAVLERRIKADAWVKVWEQPLLNEVGPVEALVSDSGDYVVTFDNWHSMGYGPNTVVIYGVNGRVIRALGLQDLLRKDHIKALPRTVSSIDWRKGQRISQDGQTLILDVIERGEDPHAKSPRVLQVRIRLADGSVLRGSI